VQGQSIPETAKLLLLAATAENYSGHTLAKAILDYAKDSAIEPEEVSDFQVTPGMGVTAIWNGTTVRKGSRDFIEHTGIDVGVSLQVIIEKLQVQGKTVVIVSKGKEVAGVISIMDAPKQGAREASDALKNIGIESIMVMGDNSKTAEAIAHLVGIERFYAGVLPSGKVEVIREIRTSSTAGIAMVGEGLNDSPALTAADVGIAIGSGTDIAIEAGDVVLVKSDIRDVVSAIEIAIKTVDKIKQNLAYAFPYNVVLIPVAAMGFLYPALGGHAMAASSVSVSASSLALKRWEAKLLG
jgi:Cu+-exporting ATPase